MSRKSNIMANVDMSSVGELITKWCSKCKMHKQIAAFTKNSTTADGLQTWCKSCGAEYRRLNREHERSYRKRRLKHFREYYAQYRKRHLKHLHEYYIKWRRANWLKCQVYDAKYWRTHLNKHRDNNARRRARKLKLPTEKVKRSVVYERDKGICHICGQKVDPNKWHLDHIIPLSKSGTHTYNNVGVSHPQCNNRKAAS